MKSSRYHLTLLAALLCFALTPTSQAQSVDPDQDAVRLEMPLFDDVMQIEVRDSDRARALDAIRKALLRMHGFAAQVSPDSPQRGSLGEINRRAGSLVPVTEDTFNFVIHAMRYCLWSGGAQGPLGGEIYRLWDEQRQGHQFTPFQLRDAVASADCSTLGLEENPRRVRIEEGSRLSGFGMERGYAMDLALDELRQNGVGNAIIETRELIVGIGPGPTGQGWLVQIPGIEGSRHPIDQIYLRDQSLAWIARDDEKLPIHHQTGVPTTGVRLVAAVTATARDAEVLAHTLYAIGHSKGQRHVGSLDPRPSVLWLLGTTDGLPLESPYRWSELDRVRIPR